MKLDYKSIELIDRQFQSFRINRQTDPYLGSNWHFHAEYELLYVLKGRGIRIVGDNISEFAPPQLALIGSKLPHLWKNDPDEDSNEADVLIVQFNRLFAGQDIFSIPEFRSISELLNLSQRGILFNKKTIKKVHNLLLNLANVGEARSLIDLQYILFELSESTEKHLISSPEFIVPLTLVSGNRLNKIIDYISKNYTQNIDLKDLSREAAMTPTSLCRFFKNRTNKTILQFISEFRVGKACQMLIDGNYSISDICFNSGFNSLTSFYRVFREIKHITPQEYKKNYKVLN